MENGVVALQNLIIAVTVLITAYTSCDPGMRCDGVMASGLEAFDGAAACGPSYEFGAVFYVPALGRRFICLDRGSAIDDSNLDIWMADRGEALEFGVREALVVVKLNMESHSAKNNIDPL